MFVKYGCPRRQQSQTMAKISKSCILTPPNPQGHVMSVKCEQPLDELTVQVWLLYDHPNINIDVCETLMPPFPNMSRIGLTFDLHFWPTDLKINRNHLLIKDWSSTHQGLSTYQVWSFLGKAFLSYQLHKVKGDRHTDRPTCATQYAPPFSKGGINIALCV